MEKQYEKSYLFPLSLSVNCQSNPAGLATLGKPYSDIRIDRRLTDQNTKATTQQMEQ